MPAALLLAGKRIAATAVQLFSASLAGAPLLHLTDDITRVHYLVDSGAALSLLPHRSLLPPSGRPIINANGGNIPSWQFVDRPLHFGNNCFTHPFLQANVPSPFWALIFFNILKPPLISVWAVCFSLFPPLLLLLSFLPLPQFPLPQFPLPYPLPP
jgi:hypothetical protein